MASILCDLLSVLLLSVLPFYIHEPTEKEDSLVLNEVELSKNHQIKSILERVVKESNTTTSDKVHFLTVRLTNDSCGILMKIVAHTRNNLSWYDGYYGYTIIDKIPVIFINKSDIEITKIPDKQAIFPMARRFDPPFFYDPEVWFFILKSNGYARYYHDRGWIWYEQEQPSNQVHLSSE